MDAQPWLQQPDESAKAYAAFCVYRDLGAERSFQAVGQELVKSRQILSRWASRYDWTDRVRAYEEHQAMLLEVARQEAIKVEAALWAKRELEQRHREWDRSTELFDKAKDLLALSINLEGYMTPKGLADVAAALEKASKIGRLAAEMETDRQEIAGDVTVKVIRGVSMDDL